MQRRHASVGDTLDDYCPRDGRVTTHTVIVVGEDGVSVTRCQVCDAEHGHADVGSPAPAGASGAADDAEPVRRSLIRATLKKPEGSPLVARPAPVFTIQQQSRGSAPARGKNATPGGPPVYAPPVHHRNGQPKQKGAHRSSSTRMFKSTRSDSGRPESDRRPGKTVHTDTARSGPKSRSSSARRGKGR